MIWLIVLLIVVLILAYLLVAPFYLEINSDDGLCRARFHRLASARLSVIDNSWILDLKIVGWHKQIDLFAQPTPQKKAVQRISQEKKAGLPFRKVWAVIRTFRINKCDLSFDFGDMPVNGILYPVVKGVSMLTGKNISINFWNENRIILEIENNFARMIWAFIKSSFTNYKNQRS